MMGKSYRLYTLAAIAMRRRIGSDKYERAGGKGNMVLFGGKGLIRSIVEGEKLSSVEIDPPVSLATPCANRLEMIELEAW